MNVYDPTSFFLLDLGTFAPESHNTPPGELVGVYFSTVEVYDAFQARLLQPGLHALLALRWSRLNGVGLVLSDFRAGVQTVDRYLRLLDRPRVQALALEAISRVLSPDAPRLGVPVAGHYPPPDTTDLLRYDPDRRPNG